MKENGANHGVVDRRYELVERLMHAGEIWGHWLAIVANKRIRLSNGPPMGGNGNNDLCDCGSFVG